MKDTGVFHRYVTVGVILSIAATIGAAALPGGSMAGAVPALVVTAGWLTLTTLRDRAMRRDADARGENARMQFAVLACDLGGAFDRCAGEFKSQLAIARGELDQVQGLFLDAIEKLVGSFTSISAHTRSQQQFVMAMASSQASGGASDCGSRDQQWVNRESAAAAGELARIACELEQDVNAAVTALQFQDTVTQLLGHVSRRADVLTGVAEKIGTLAGVLAAAGMPAIEDETRTQGVRRACDELADLAASVHQATIGNPVRQTSMATGEVEMF